MGTPIVFDGAFLSLGNTVLGGGWTGHGASDDGFMYSSTGCTVWGIGYSEVAV